jgi:hypothetical protein
LDLPIITHIDSLIDQIDKLESEIEKIPFSKITRSLSKSNGNYRNGLKIIREAFTECLTKKAELHAKSATKDNKYLSPEQVLYSFYSELISISYSTAERFNTDACALVESGLPWELYHWLLDIPEFFGIEKVIVFQEGERFLTETFDQRLIRPLKPMIEVARNPEVKGTLAQLKPIDLTERNPITIGYVVSCIRGEVQNPVLWPVLCHEMFEVVDKEKGLFTDFLEFVSKKGKTLPSLDDDHITNQNWISELLIDFLTINSFGPMYAKSLIEYFKRSPYYPTHRHPPPSFRLFCAFPYLQKYQEVDTDIFGKCQLKARHDTQREMQAHKESLNSEKEKQLSDLNYLMAQFFETIKIPSFIDKLVEYSEQTANPKVTLVDILKDESKFISFQDPPLNFDDIKNNILYHHISLAVRPEIILNVVLANYDLYSKSRHLTVIIDSIKKWKIKQVWDSSVKALRENS